MANLTNAVASLVIFSLLLVLSINVYDGFDVGYNFTGTGDILTLNATNSSTGETYTGTITDHLKNMQILVGVEQITNRIEQLPAATNILDIIGNLASVGIGVLKVILGLVIFPQQICYIVTNFYAGAVPAVLTTIVVTLITLYIGFIMLTAYLRRESQI